MNGFKEWLSDYLRYIILALAALLAAGAVFLGVRLYQEMQSSQQAQPAPEDGSGVVIIDGETESESETEPVSETEATSEQETSGETEKVTEAETDTEPETQTESGTDRTDSTAETGSQETASQGMVMIGNTDGTGEQTSGEPAEETMVVVGETSGTPAGASQTEAQVQETETDPPETDPPETDPPETDPPEPVYMTMTGACYIRSYPDYGDNIIGEYPAGTVVEFLEDVGGWYHVQVDGLDGYMGARFFS